MILMNPAPASANDFEQLWKERAEKRAEIIAQRKAIVASAAYKQGDPDAVAAYYRIHFRSALARPEDLEKIVARLRASFTRKGILKARTIEASLLKETLFSPDFDLLLRLKTLRIPTLVIYGDHDFIPGAVAKQISRAIPNSRMVTLKDYGHFAYLESPAAVRQEIESFLRR